MPKPVDESLLENHKRELLLKGVFASRAGNRGSAGRSASHMAAPSMEIQTAFGAMELCVHQVLFDQVFFLDRDRFEFLETVSAGTAADTA